MRTLRRIVFYLFLAVYAVAAPATILFAFGFSIRPGQPTPFVRTGLIVLDTVPPGARVFVGGRRFTWRTPTTIRNLAPGDYAVRLSVPGHLAWENTVRVEAEKATVLNRILLPPETPEVRTCDPSRFESLDPTPGPETLLLSRGTRAGDLWVWSADEDRARTVLPRGHPLEGARIARQFTMTGSPRVLLQTESSDGITYLWIDIEDADEAPADVTALFPVPPDELAWDTRDPDTLFVLANGQASRLNLDARAIYPGVLGGVTSLAVHRDRLYALNRSNQFLRARFDGEGAEPAGRAPAEVKSLWRSPAPYRIQPLDADTTLFIGHEGSLYANIEPFVLAERGVLGFEISEEDDSILVWDSHRLGRVTVEAVLFGTNRPQARLQWLQETARPFDQAFRVFGGSHILIAGDGRAELLPLAEAGGGPPRFLSSIARDTRVSYNDRTGLLHFLAPETRLLTELRVAPDHTLLTLPRRRETTEVLDR